MSFIGKCYNGHKTLLDDELEGETVECPVCDEEFIASSKFEELGKIEEWEIQYHTKGYFHMVLGLFIGGLLTYFLIVLSKNSNFFFWKFIINFSLILGGLYMFRGLYELFWNKDPFRRVIQGFFAVFYILWKKIKFYKR